MSITVTQLKTFLAVVRSGSVTAAADELVVTQPSVSSAIAALGRELGCDVFARSGRGIRLTEGGAAFAPYAETVIGLLEDGRRAVQESTQLARRRLQLAAVTTAAESFVPPLLRAFTDRHPEVEVTLSVGNRQSVLERVRSRTVDVAIAGRPPEDAGVIAEPLIDNEIACITFPGDPLATAGPLDAGDLAERVWLLRERGSGTRSLCEEFLAARGIEPKTLTLGSNGAIKQAARVGLGISLLSRSAIEAELAAGRLAELELADGPERRSWFVLRSAVGPVREPVEQFVAFALGAVGTDAAWH